MLEIAKTLLTGSLLITITLQTIPVAIPQEIHLEDSSLDTVITWLHHYCTIISLKHLSLHLVQFNQGCLIFWDGMRIVSCWETDGDFLMISGAAANPTQATPAAAAPALAPQVAASPYQGYNLTNVDMSSFQGVDWGSMYGVGMYV
ncbi:hypothetical protein NQ317_004773 [Molorchus minor]|uniref:Uncharacterized protein n=1 Tax=Molorchus minor TaxID=1323400 RepID=A0ABQ9JII8_9CUCU|nr:hypothetical protein NQ317_004773 [Molorchus minor]